MSKQGIVSVAGLITASEFSDLNDLIDTLQNYDYEARVQKLLDKQTR
mgnify:CR=1 FL=1